MHDLMMTTYLVADYRQHFSQAREPVPVPAQAQAQTQTGVAQIRILSGEVERKNRRR